MRKARRVETVVNPSVKKGYEFVDDVVEVWRNDVLDTNVMVTVTTAAGKKVTAQLDLIMKDRTVYELKDIAGNITPSKANEIIEQIGRQRQVMAEFKGAHGGLIVGPDAHFSDDILAEFRDASITVIKRTKEGAFDVLLQVD